MCKHVCVRVTVHMRHTRLSVTPVKKDRLYTYCLIHVFLCATDHGFPLVHLQVSALVHMYLKP